MSAARTAVVIRDVGPRDGLQGEAPLDVSFRVNMSNALAAAGVQHVEAVAFVSPKAVPAMSGAADVVAGLEPGAATWWALVPNRRGAEMALGTGLRHLTVTVSASPVYSEKNVGMTVAESIAQVESICSLQADVVVDAVVSCAFGSSFDDAVTAADVASVCASLQNAGVQQLTLADTTGTATPRRIESVLQRTGLDVGLHLHDTRGTALTNAFAAIELGITRFDTAVGGLGGSPFAPGAGGNLATESLVLLLDDMGIQTGVRLDALLDIGKLLSEAVGRELPSRVLRAGGLPPFPG
ncbi:MAG: hydroxymethylglutaryl-CoA lyase [Ilumatobacteraceae bacterium]|nr:hydroxymethylglutaryl-CoA lyase [Ilumatobacteraceae bacterium]